MARERDNGIRRKTERENGRDLERERGMSQEMNEPKKDKSIAFLDVYVTRHDDGSVTTRVFQKPSNTNIGIKPNSCQDPKITISAFKGELCRCHRLCSSPEETQKEINFVLDLYEDNGHDRAKLKKIADAYTPPSGKKNDSNNKKENKATKVKPKLNETEEATKALFSVLPFNNGEHSDDDIMFACITYVPELSHQLKRAYANAGINTTFLSAPKLKDILCGKNTTKPPKEKRKGIYKYECPCSKKSVYVGQTGRSYEKRWAEHKYAIDRENWSHSGVSQHHQHCPHQFDAKNFSVIHNMQGKNKRRLGYDMRMREALEIQRHKCGPGQGLNEDMGAYVKTDIWDTVLNAMG